MDNKEQMELDHAQKMNEEAVERMKKDTTLTPAEAERIEKVFFEDDETIKLRDGRTYRIPPCNLKDARKLMRLIKTVNIDAIIINFVPTGDDAIDKQREDDLFEILGIAFKNYPHIVTQGEEGYVINRGYLDEHVDLNTARKIIDILIGLNGIKK